MLRREFVIPRMGRLCLVGLGILSFGPALQL